LKKAELHEQEAEFCEEYFYDSNGRVSKKVCLTYGDGGNYTTTTYYEYVSFDAKGNWTKRIAKEPGNVRTETRKIVYYE
jgi:hypothetical protein